jgi:hypothetical protein
VSARLDVAQEVPKLVVKAPGATGLFRGTYVEHARSATLKWRLTYVHLTGTATAAHIHVGKPGAFGNVLVSLCAANCRSGLTGTTKLSLKLVAQMQAGKIYVNVHTTKNPNGEIRGQVTAKRRAVNPAGAK